MYLYFTLLFTLFMYEFQTFARSKETLKAEEAELQQEIKVRKEKFKNTFEKKIDLQEQEISILRTNLKRLKKKILLQKEKHEARLREIQNEYDLIKLEVESTVGEKIKSLEESLKSANREEQVMIKQLIELNLDFQTQWLQMATKDIYHDPIQQEEAIYDQILSKTESVDAIIQQIKSLTASIERAKQEFFDKQEDELYEVYSDLAKVQRRLGTKDYPWEGLNKFEYQDFLEGVECPLLDLDRGARLIPLFHKDFGFRFSTRALEKRRLVSVPMLYFESNSAVQQLKLFVPYESKSSLPSSFHIPVCEFYNLLVNSATPEKVELELDDVIYTLESEWRGVWFRRRYHIWVSSVSKGPSPILPTRIRFTFRKKKWTALNVYEGDHLYQRFLLDL